MKKIWGILFAVCVMPFASGYADTLSQPLIAQKPIDKMISEIGIDQKLNQQLPLSLEFRDEKGGTVRLGDYFGSKPVILSLVYFRCPMLCSLVLEGMVKSLRPLKLNPGKDFQMITVSIDPKDTPEKALEKKERLVKSYNRPGAEENWHFLTGDQASIDALTQAVGFRYVYDPQSKQYAHAGGIIVNTPEGKIARYFYGIEYSSRDIQFGLIEAAQGKIGSLVDQIILLCFHYDPMTGTYGFLVMNLLRGFAVLTAVGTVIGIGFMLRREHGSKAGAA